MPQLTNNPSPNLISSVVDYQTGDSTAQIDTPTTTNHNAAATANPTATSISVQESAVLLPTELLVAGTTNLHYAVDPSSQVGYQTNISTGNPTASTPVQESAVLLLTVFSVAGTFAALYHQASPNVRPWLLCSLVGFVVSATLCLVGKYLRRKLPAVAYLATFLIIAGAGLAVTFLFVSLALVLR